MMNHAVDLKTDVTVMICVIAQIQLASRHPANNGESKAVAEKFAREVQQKISEIYPTAAAIIEMGWNREYDI